MKRFVIKDALQNDHVVKAERIDTDDRFFSAIDENGNVVSQWRIESVVGWEERNG